MSTTDRPPRNNEAYAAAFDKGDLPMPPGRKTAVVACMDARLNVYGALGLSEGDAHVIRNAGGVVSDDAIRSLAISQRLLGTEEIILIHHTDCGMLTFSDADFKNAIEQETGIRPVVGRRGVLRSRRRRAPVDRADQGVAVHPAQGLDPRVRLRGRERAPARSELTPPRPRRGVASALHGELADERMRFRAFGSWTSRASWPDRSPR